MAGGPSLPLASIAGQAVTSLPSDMRPKQLDVLISFGRCGTSTTKALKTLPTLDFTSDRLRMFMPKKRSDVIRMFG